MLLTGFQADFFHQPVTVEEFVSKSDAYKFVGRVIRTHCRKLQKSQDGFICSQKELRTLQSGQELIIIAGPKLEDVGIPLRQALGICVSSSNSE